MYINFQQNHVSRSVKIVHTNILAANNRKLHTFATTNSNFVKRYYFSHELSYNVFVYQFLGNSGY